MIRGLFVVVVAAVAFLGTSTRGGAAGTVSAQVDPVATVTSNVTVVFDFDLYNCPPGAEIVIVDWQAKEPARPDSGAAAALFPYGLSNGDPVQHLTLQANSGGFLAGEQWVGSGSIACGAVVIPVEGSGQAKSVTGL